MAKFNSGMGNDDEVTNDLYFAPLARYRVSAYRLDTDN